MTDIQARVEVRQVDKLCDCSVCVARKWTHSGLWYTRVFITDMHGKTGEVIQADGELEFFSEEGHAREHGYEIARQVAENLVRRAQKMND